MKWPASFLVVVLMLVASMQDVRALQCYECVSSEHFSCTEFWDPTSEVNQQYLNDCGHVEEAVYCVKMSGIFDGKLGTKRFCSARDWGDYCEYIERPGDSQEYRSCVFTCQKDACNAAASITSLVSIPLILAGFISHTLFSS